MVLIKKVYSKCFVTRLQEVWNGLFRIQWDASKTSTRVTGACYSRYIQQTHFNYPLDWEMSSDNLSVGEQMLPYTKYKALKYRFNVIACNLSPPYAYFLVTVKLMYKLHELRMNKSTIFHLSKNFCSLTICISKICWNNDEL